MKVTRALTIVAVAGVLACVAPAQPTISAVLNAASYSAIVAPGSWVAIFGTNLASAASAQSVPLPLTLGGTSVSVGGMAASMLYASANQVNVLIPAEVAIPANTVVPVVVTSSAGKSTTYNIRLSRNAPAIFTRNGAGTGRALVFDSNFRAADTIGPQDAVILYANGLGPTDASGQVTDSVEVYIGERKAQVKFAGLAPGFPGIYQLNVTAPAPATDRLYLRAGGWQSNLTDVGIRNSVNTANVTGSIDGLYPSKDPFFTLPLCVGDDPQPPCGSGEGLSIMLHAGIFSVSFDVLPSASPFDVAAVGAGGGVIISIDPAAGAFTASLTTISPAAAAGDFSKSVVPLWDYMSCSPLSAICLPFPGPSIMPPNRMDPFWLQATRQLPAPDTIIPATPNASMQVSGRLSGSRLIIDSQNNSALSRFGGILQVPYGPFEKDVSTFKLYVDGKLVSSKDLPYSLTHR